MKSGARDSSIRALFAPSRPAAAANQLRATCPATGAQAARLKESPASLGGLLQAGGFIRRCASLDSHGTCRWPGRIRIFSALTGDGDSGRQGLRPLAPPAFATASRQRNFADRLVGARPFNPSSPLSPFGFRADRIGGLNLRDFSTGSAGNESRGSLVNNLPSIRDLDRSAHFPRSGARQDSTFPRGKCGRAAGAHLPPSLRVSGTLRDRLAFGSLFFNPRIRVKTKTHA